MFSYPPSLLDPHPTSRRGTPRDTLRNTSSIRGGRKWTWVKNNLSLPVSKSTIFGIILAVGLTAGAGFLIAHSGSFPYSSWVHDIAIGGTALFGTSTLAGIIYTGKNYYDRYQRMKTRPGLFPDIEDQTRPPQNRNMARVRDNIRLDSDTFNTRLQLATKMDKDGGLHRGSRTSAVYYDLTQVPTRSTQNPIADELDLGDQGTFLQIPHIGKHESGYLHNDHYMAVRLPSSQLEKFPQPIQRDMAGIKNPEIFFMVFKRPAGAEDGIYDLALHAMALDNYEHTAPVNPTGGLREGQSIIHPEGGGEGLQTTMQIRMRNTVGIDLDYSVGPERDPAALTGDAKIVHPSIHTDRSDAHRFSDKHARIKVDESAPVSCFDISVKTSDGRGIVLRALIINDEESDAGNDVLEAVRTDSLEGFLDRIVEGDEGEPELDQGIIDKVTGVLTPPAEED
jgi:hypothetical protein